ncbi:hypothetical protein LS71_002665 [Helicobacter jaachi]|uniref:DUF1640 domain-containing protein n=1 Tax=Helicobacter jaachi TaxID=1677920 RepID=A0A4U8TCH8_9HELI|nr:hypothetical protein [Helicobacter jaachi]TLD97661.1 hypothetical protein LS71_002665 [Helicobacter jaachi]
MSAMHFSKSFELAIFSLWDKIEHKHKIEKEEFLNLVEAALQEAEANIEQHLETKLATKDFVSYAIRESELSLKVEIHKNKTEIIKWLIGVQFACAGLIVALIKLL